MAHFKYKNQNVYYQLTGEGQPLLLLHGNTASSAMFDSLIESYSPYFKLILLDFPGHGKSDRLSVFETDFWYENAKVCVALLEELKLEKVAVVGSSGGALVALNLALEHPEKIRFLIADSFEGAYPLESYMHTLEEDREKGKSDPDTKAFWQYCHGDDWENIVDLDTDMLLRFNKLQHSFFHQSISELRVPTLLTGSRKDEFCDYLDQIYNQLKTQNNALQIHLFEEGLHPAILSNAKEFLELLLNTHQKI